VELQPEWNEFLDLLAAHRVRYVMIGALAVAAHGRPRFTMDLDVFVEPSLANARRLGRVLADFGFRTPARAWKRLARPGKVLSLGTAPIGIDILTSVSGLTFAQAWKGRLVIAGSSGNVFVLGLAGTCSTSRCSTRSSSRRLLELQAAVRARAALAQRRRGPARGARRVIGLGGRSADRRDALALEGVAPTAAIDVGDLRDVILLDQEVCLGPSTLAGARRAPDENGDAGLEATVA
jgi:hypothetical protein